MALISISLDTTSRQTVLTVNGVLVPVEEFSVSKWIDHEGDEELSFSYTVVAENEQGLKETRRFYLPSPPTEASAEAEGKEEGETAEVVKPDAETGLVSEVVQEPIQPDDEDIQKDLGDVFNR